MNLTTNQEIAHTVQIADTFYTRLKGLLGEKQIDAGTTLWIHRCNSIHTWFMKFAIDAVFVDKKLVVRAKFENLHPWKLSFPVWKAKSVFELPAGTLREKSVAIGDQLYVGD